MIEPKHLNAAIRSLWRHSGAAGPDTEALVIIAAQLERITAALEAIATTLPKASYEVARAVDERGRL